MRNKALLALALLLSALIVKGQSEYFSTDIKTSYGVKLVDGGDLINSQLCQVKTGNKIVKYSPYEVQEYGLKNGRVYIARKINSADSSKMVFLERLYNGKTTLYYYRGSGIKIYFIEKDSTVFIEIPKKADSKKHYSEVLSNYTADCPNVSSVCKLVSYSKKSISKLISRYDNCELKPFPHFRYGLLMGYEVSKLIASDEHDEYLEYFDFDYEGSPSIGIFLDNPVLASDFSVHMELLFSKHAFSYYNLTGNRELDFVANLSVVNVPLFVRYTYPSNKIRPFINLGPIGSYIVKNETLLFETILSENAIEINVPKQSASMISDFQAGGVIGSGLEYKLNYKNSLFFELRYINQFSQGDSEFPGSTAFCVLAGINF